jgi:hypothetical protein
MEICLMENEKRRENLKTVAEDRNIKALRNLRKISNHQDICNQIMVFHILAGLHHVLFLLIELLLYVKHIKKTRNT